ncbi:MAG: flotillin, partial [Calditrichaeota bacterium]|nr:flotillin [Calditrichota bacterium]
MDFISAIIFIVVILAVVVVMMVSRLLNVCHPNEVVILSGRKRKLPDGSIVGYRLIRGGRAVRMPVLEKAARMSLESIPLELSVRNAYSKGGIPLNVDAIANIKIDSTEPAFGNAVERFLMKPMQEIHQIAKDTLEGNLRGVLASLTPEEVNEDRLKFAQSLIEEADNDLNQLGLQLDTLKIQNVADEAGYLDSIGRRKTAEVLSTARMAEAAKAAEAEQAEAEARQFAEIAKAKADQEIKAAQISADREVKMAKARADAAARQAEAEQEAVAKEAEATSLRKAEVAKAMADQEIRTSQIKADQEVKVSRAIADQQIETENNNLRMKKAELEREAIIMEKEAEVAGQKAQAKYEQDMEEERILLQQKR